MLHRPLALLLALLPACNTPSRSSIEPAAAASGDPREGRVPLAAAAEGWEASLVWDAGSTGVWRVDSLDVFPQYASREVVALDDRGRLMVAVPYSGRWTPFETVHEGVWLGGLAQGDVDPEVAGLELYTASQDGNVWQILAWPEGVLDCRRIAHLGRAVHTLVSADLDPFSSGDELVAFTDPGALYQLEPGGPGGTFEVHSLGERPGRVRDAVALPFQVGRLTEVATASRDGRLELVSLTPDGPRWSLVHRASSGLGRVALAPPLGEGATVLYSTTDDGRVLRHERAARGGEWRTETIYLGPEGPRGLAAGRFAADPGTETVAVFGYSGRVELLTRQGGVWNAETLFEDRDRGHWLASAELDGRNGTDELLACGYGGRVVLLARRAGYGRDELASEL